MCGGLARRRGLRHQQWRCECRENERSENTDKVSIRFHHSSFSCVAMQAKGRAQRGVAEVGRENWRKFSGKRTRTSGRPKCIRERALRTAVCLSPQRRKNLAAARVGRSAKVSCEV